MNSEITHMLIREIRVIKIIREVGRVLKGEQTWKANCQQLVETTRREQVNELIDRMNTSKKAD